MSGRSLTRSGMGNVGDENWFFPQKTSKRRMHISDRKGNERVPTVSEMMNIIEQSTLLDQVSLFHCGYNNIRLVGISFHWVKIREPNAFTYTVSWSDIEYIYSVRWGPFHHTIPIAICCGVIQWFQGIMCLLTTSFLPGGINTTANNSTYNSINTCIRRVINKKDNNNRLS